MRLLIVVPPQVRTTGNWVTARRLQAGLVALGHEVNVCPAVPEEMRAALAQGVDLALLMHAYRSGRPWRALNVDIPCMVMLTGTDFHEGLSHPVQGPVIENVLQWAKLVLIKNRREMEAFGRKYPEFAERLRYLPPGVVLGNAPCDLREKSALTNDDILFLCPAGIRPVKGVLKLLKLFDAVADTRSFQVAFCGPILDDGYGDKFLAAVAKRSWAHYVGELPTAAMPAALCQADVVLNNSVSEGLPNALVEAATLGRPILAHAIPGNEDVVVEGVNGLLYRDGDGFTAAALRLIDDPKLRKQLSRPDPERFSPQHEAQLLAELCLTILEQQKNNH